MKQKKVTVPGLVRAKSAETPIVAVTAYDFPFARIADQAGIDFILVGDSLGMVVQGNDTTLPVTMDEVIYHSRMVARARQRALIVADMPFGSYQTDPHDAVVNATRLIKEGAAEAVKLEGGQAVAETIRRIAAVDIPGDGPHRFDASIGAPHGRAQGAGTSSRQRAGAARACAGGRAGGRGRRGVCGRPRGNSDGTWRRRSPRPSRFPPSASAPDRVATVRSSCCTTCSACARVSHRSSRSNMRTSGARRGPRWRLTPARCVSTRFRPSSTASSRSNPFRRKTRSPREPEGFLDHLRPSRLDAELVQRGTPSR